MDRALWNTVVYGKSSDTIPKQIYWPERKLERKGQKPQEDNLKSRDLHLTLSKAFKMSKVTAKVSLKWLRGTIQESIK